MRRDTTNVEYEIYDYTSNNWRHRNSNKSFEEKFGNSTTTAINIFTKKKAMFLTSVIVWKVLQSATWSLSGSYRRWFKEEKESDKRHDDGDDDDDDDDDDGDDDDDDNNDDDNNNNNNNNNNNKAVQTCLFAWSTRGQPSSAGKL